jgi:hypothetical protein
VKVRGDVPVGVQKRAMLLGGIIPRAGGVRPAAHLRITKRLAWRRLNRMLSKKITYKTFIVEWPVYCDVIDVSTKFRVCALGGYKGGVWLSRNTAEVVASTNRTGDVVFGIHLHHDIRKGSKPLFPERTVVKMLLDNITREDIKQIMEENDGR